MSDYVIKGFPVAGGTAKYDYGALVNAPKQLYANVKDFGAAGDGVTDDTKAIQTAVAALTDNSTLYFPGGVYLVNPASNNESIILIAKRKNVTICGDSAKIKCAANGFPMYRIINVDMSDNVVIKDLEIEGDRLTHDYTTTAGTHENSYGIFVGGSETTNPVNVKILNCNIHDITGDSIATKNGVPGGTILIKDCELHHCRRQGISVLDVDINIIDGCYIHHIGDHDGIEGAAPKCGIDFEPASGTYITKKVVVKNTTIEECTHLTVVSSLSYKYVQDVEFENCIFCGVLSLANTGGADPADENSVRGKFKHCEFRITGGILDLRMSTIENCTFFYPENHESWLGKTVGSQFDGNGYYPKVRFNYNAQPGPHVINSVLKGMSIHALGSNTVFGEAINSFFEDCRYTMYNGASSAIFNNCTIKNPSRATEPEGAGYCTGVFYNKCLIINDCEYKEPYYPTYTECTVITQS